MTRKRGKRGLGFAPSHKRVFYNAAAIEFALMKLLPPDWQCVLLLSWARRDHLAQVWLPKSLFASEWLGDDLFRGSLKPPYLSCIAIPRSVTLNRSECGDLKDT